MSKEVQRGVNAVLVARLKDTTGAYVSPDQAPVITALSVNGTDKLGVVAATIAQATDEAGQPIVGHYNITVPTAGLQYNDQVDIEAAAVVEGFETQVNKDFTVSSDASRRPVFY